MDFLRRIEIALRVTLLVLVVGLIAAVGGGILLRPPEPVGYAAVDGQPLLHQSGTGPTTLSRTAVPFREHRIGVGTRCNGAGSLRLDLDPFGSVEANCAVHDTSDGGFVLSNIPFPSTRWQVRTAVGNRWSVVLTQPINTDGDLQP